MDITQIIISIHALVKRATQLRNTFITALGISIHALVKRATGYHHHLYQNNQNISIHALVKRATNTGKEMSTMNLISIHALVKRATYPTDEAISILTFQSTPSWRGRLNVCHAVDRGKYFNPRPREEGDLIWQVIFIYMSISIHALVKRATMPKKTIKDYVKISIHALVKRATNIVIYQRLLRLYFNPRPREEGDPVYIPQLFIFPDFNPRPREEGDQTL